MTKRITPKISEKAVYLGEKAVQIAEDAFFDVENFYIKSIVSGEKAGFESEEDTTLSVLKKCLEASGLGHELAFNEKDKRWDFSVISGKENDTILSEAHKNVYNTGISFDILDYATCGRYRKETADGYESVSVIKDAEKTGIYRWEASLSEETKELAEEELDALAHKYELSASTHGIAWKKDYNLGDILRVQVIKGNFKKNENRKVEGVELCFSGGKYTERPIFE